MAEDLDSIVPNSQGKENAHPLVEPGYTFHDLKSEGLVEILDNAPVYTKFGEVKARIVTSDEEVITRIKDREETKNMAHPGDAIVTGPQGEEYVLSSAKLEARYRPVVDKPGVYEAFGKIRAVDNPYGEKIAIVPAWGGYQYGDEVCKVATTVNPETEKPNDPDDLYIIDLKSFQETYKPKPTE